MRQRSLILISLVALAACTCHAGVIHVPADWPTIAAGVGAASFGDTVVVAAGYYVEHDIEMKSGVWVRSASGNASSVTIDAADLGRVFSFEATEQPCGIEGLTITRGLVEIYGGAVYCSEGTAAFRNCTFALNVAGGSIGDMGVGGALYAELSTVTIDGCEFHDNSVTLRGGAVCSVTTDLTVESSVFVHNMGAALGGGIYSGSGPLEVVGCEFRDNMAWGGGAVAVYGLGSVVAVRNSRFDRNWARVGGGGALFVRWPTSFVAEGCAFFENEAGGLGGAAYFWSGSPSTFIGCSFVRSTGQGAPALYVWETGVSLENCIVAFTTAGAAIVCVPAGYEEHGHARRKRHGGRDRSR